MLTCNKLVQSRRIEMGRRFADDGFSCVTKEAFFSPGFLLGDIGFFGGIFLSWKVSRHLTSPIAHSASDSDPRN